MSSVSLAESAIFLKLKAISCLLLVLAGTVVALFALRASECNAYAHVQLHLSSCWDTYS